MASRSYHNSSGSTCYDLCIESFWPVSEFWDLPTRRVMTRDTVHLKIRITMYLRDL